MSEFLYHYTDIDGLQGILKTNHLRATDIFTSNDYTEFRWGIGLLSRSLIRERNFSEEDVDLLVGKFFELLTSETMVRGIFVTCFSTVRDNSSYPASNGLLSQWRGYGSYAIKFRKDLLTEALHLNENHTFFEKKVSYFDQSGIGIKGRNFTNEWKSEIEILSTACALLANLTKEGKAVKLLTDHADFLYTALSSFLHIGLFSKHCGFQEEEEFRASAFIWRSSDIPIKFYTTHKAVKSYVEIFQDQILNAIDCIIIGPNNLSRYSRKNLDCMMKGLGIKKVIFSETPYLPNN